jgi:Acetyl xylan esterase (AXE1)
MNRLSVFVLFVSMVLSTFSSGLYAANGSDQSEVVTLNTPRSFPEIKTRAQWKKRAKEIREQVLISCGLWPLPERTPLREHIFDRIERDGYSVEKVYFQTYPGFYLAGNLYRPLGKGKGPFPGVLNPHGHWSHGRLENTKDASVPARCISYARMGMVAFSYDMVGYNDTHFPYSQSSESEKEPSFYKLHREFGTNHSDQLWSISLMGLQTWNSIRALDFLASLPEVDKKHLACSGASGGGTQTFMLGAVDDRLAAQAPVCMVSHTMQGGCSCENAPGLRVEYSNMEIAAAPAPRPQILVAATGDWTKTMPEVEGPAVQRIYGLFGEADRLRYVQFDFGHNYNQTSREAVYAWFGKWLLNDPNPESLKEQPYQMEPAKDLRVFPDGKLPDDALPMDRFTESLKQEHREQWQALVPHNKTSVKNFKRAVFPAWKHTLQLEWPPSNVNKPKDVSANGGKPLIVLAGLDDEQSLKSALSSRLQDQSRIISLSIPEEHNPPDQFKDFFTTYNRTELQRAVGFLVNHCYRSPRTRKHLPLVLCGTGHAGLPALLASPAADAVVADCDQLDATSDAALLAPDLFCPGIRNIGTFEGAAMLAAPHPLLLHNTGDKFPTDAIRTIYRVLGASDKLRIETRKLSDQEIAEWIAKVGR